MTKMTKQEFLDICNKKTELVIPVGPELYDQIMEAFREYWADWLIDGRTKDNA